MKHPLWVSLVVSVGLRPEKDMATAPPPQGSYFLFWPHPWHAAAPGIELTPQQQSEPQQRQCQILNPLSHQGTPRSCFLIEEYLTDISGNKVEGNYSEI